MLTVFCAVGLLIQSLYLIALVASGVQNNIATIVILIVSEVIPTFVLLVLLHPARVQGHYHGGRGSLKRTVSTSGLMSVSTNSNPSSPRTR